MRRRVGVMASVSPARPRRLVTLVLAFVAGLAAKLATSEPHAAEAAALDACSAKCGPVAPCCMLLTYPWCGCWFDDEQQQ